MGKFENDIEHQLSDFRLEPSPQVWNDIETAIQQRRRRRVVGWWWFPLLAVVVGITGWGLFQYSQHKTADNKTASPIVKDESTKTPLYSKPTEDVSEKANKGDNYDVYVEHKAASTNHPSDSLKQNYTAAITHNVHVRRSNKSTGMDLAAISQQSIKASNNLTQRSDVVFSSRMQENSVSPTQLLHDRKTSSQAAWVKGAIAAVYPKNLSVILGRQLSFNTTQSIHKNVQQQQIPVVKKVDRNRWYITAGGGASLIAGKPLVQNIGIPLVNVGSAGNPTFGPGASYVKTYAKPSTGYFLTAGIGYQYALSSRLQLLTGLSYRYLANNIDTGKTVKNYQHSIQVPLGVQYTINPQAKLKVSVQAGAAITWNLKQQWLAIDEAKGYHYNSGLNQKANTSLFAGLAITNAKGWRLSVQFEQGLQTLQQAPSQPYCSQLVGMHLGLPLR